MAHDNFHSELLDESSTQQVPNFEYGVLKAETRIFIQQRTNEIKTLMRRNCQDIIDIGQKLIEVKQRLGHGSFRNWLKSEFNWSVSTATKLMQVAEQFKCVNFTHLNITASTLYLVAAPSTPKEARIEVLERASKGENISYTKAKAIVGQHKKTNKVAVKPKNTSLNPDESVNFIEPTRHDTTSEISAQKDLTEKKEVQIETRSRSSSSLALKTQQITTSIKDDYITQRSTSIENLATISHETLDTAIAEMVTSIKNLTPEQLAKVIRLAACNGLSEYHLSAIIEASQQALSSRQ
jgi:hypothetical protein